MAAVIVVLLVAAGVHLAGSVVRRPEGAAERFLQTASRPSADDRERAESYGPVELARALIEFDRDDTDRAWFRRIEVGHGIRAGELARVPARVTRNDRAETVESFTLVLEQQPGSAPRGWRVVGRQTRAPGERVPSEGGAKPASAPVTTWLVALGLGALLTVGSELVLRSLGARPRDARLTRRPGAAAR
jgi:hypothetical protein